MGFEKKRLDFCSSTRFCKTSFLFFLEETEWANGAKMVQVTKEIKLESWKQSFQLFKVQLLDSGEEL